MHVAAARYHAMVAPRLFSDANGDRPMFDAPNVAPATSRDGYYSDFSAWDTYRAHSPLITLIDPRRQQGEACPHVLCCHSLPSTCVSHTYGRVQPFFMLNARDVCVSVLCIHVARQAITTHRPAVIMPHRTPHHHRRHHHAPMCLLPTYTAHQRCYGR